MKIYIERTQSWHDIDPVTHVKGEGPVQDGDVIINSNLKFDGPTAIFRGIENLRFVRCNLGNVLWYEPVVLTDENGVKHSYEAAPWTATWEAVKSYNMPQKPMHYLESVRQKQRLLAQLESIKEQLLSMNKAGENEGFRMAVRPYIMSGIGWVELEKVLGVKLDHDTIPVDWREEVA
jgi:hypothetical protein